MWLVVRVSLPGWLPGVERSNHDSFAREGYPAVMVTDTGKSRNKDMRTRFDTFTRLNYEDMARVVSSLKRVIENLARVGA